MKAKLVECDYIFFLESNTVFDLRNPFDFSDGLKKIIELPICTWTRVDVAIGSEVKKRGASNIPAELEGRFYEVDKSFPKKFKFPVLIGSL